MCLTQVSAKVLYNNFIILVVILFTSVRTVLHCLLQMYLFVKAEKREFHQSTVSFLGFILFGGNVQIDLVKLQAVLEWQAPEKHKNLSGSWDLQTPNEDSLRATVQEFTSPQTHICKTETAFVFEVDASV